MTRAPVAAWRRLVAAGGAPATSHAVLARAPAPERLLEPMAGVRLVGQTWLDALARPLDVSGVLARVLNARPAAETTTALDADGSIRARRASRRVGSDDTAAARMRHAIGVLHERDTSPPMGSATADDDVRPPRPRAAPPAGVRAPARPRPDALDEPWAAPRPSSTAPATHDIRAGRWLPPMGTEAQIGATTRVLVGAPQHDVERLVARGDPTPPIAGTAANATRPSGTTRERASAEAMGQPARPRDRADAASLSSRATGERDAAEALALPVPSGDRTDPIASRSRATRERDAAEALALPVPSGDRTDPIASRSRATRERTAGEAMGQPSRSGDLADVKSLPSRTTRERDAAETMELSVPSSDRAEAVSPPSPSRAARAPVDAAALLVRAVERVGDRTDPTSHTPALAAPDSLVPGRTTAPPETEPRDRAGTAPVPHDATSGGGFRGLALRTLGASDGPRHIPVRLEREARAGSEVPLDDLDSRVAESLARILEREARRHGIDVTGARA